METTQASRELSSKELYSKIISRLQSISHEEERIRHRPNEAIFLDDMLLRLKRWCTYVEADSFDWADRIHSVGNELIALLFELNDAVEKFDEALDFTISSESNKDTKIKGNLSGTTFDKSVKESNQKRLQDTTEKLTSYTSPLRAINSIPQSERTNESSIKINSGITRRQSELKSKIIPNGFFLLDHVITTEDAHQSLLGAIVFNPRKPFYKFISVSQDEIIEFLGAQWRSTKTLHDFSRMSERSISASVKASIPHSVSAGLGIPMDIQASAERSTQSRESFGPVKLTRYTMKGPHIFIRTIVDRIEEAIKEWGVSSVYVAVDVMTIGEEEALFAVAYCKVTWKRKLPWRSSGWKIEQADYGNSSPFF